MYWLAAELVPASSSCGFKLNIIHRCLAGYGFSWVTYHLYVTWTTVRFARHWCKHQLRSSWLLKKKKKKTCSSAYLVIESAPNYISGCEWLVLNQVRWKHVWLGGGHMYPPKKINYKHANSSGYKARVNHEMSVKVVVFIFFFLHRFIRTCLILTWILPCVIINACK